MKVIFMGTPEFALPSLKALIKFHNVLAVVCQPDKPNKRGKKIEYGAIKRFALENGLAVLQPESVKDAAFIQQISELNPDVICVAAYGKILPPEVLKIPPFGCINVHASLLPKYRGAAPIQWAIINGDDHSGITIMRMRQGLDTGDMLEKRHVVIEMTDTYGTLLEKMSVVGADALINSLSELTNGTSVTIIQNDAEATYAPIIKKEIGNINWRNTGKDIVNLIRGLNPTPGAYSELEGRKLKIWKAEVYGKSEANADFGTVIGVISKRGVIVNAASQSVILTELQLSGGKKMPAPVFLRGCPIQTGTMLK